MRDCLRVLCWLIVNEDLQVAKWHNPDQVFIYIFVTNYHIHTLQSFPQKK